MAREKTIKEIAARREVKRIYIDGEVYLIGDENEVESRELRHRLHQISSGISNISMLMMSGISITLTVPELLLRQLMEESNGITKL